MIQDEFFVSRWRSPSILFCADRQAPFSSTVFLFLKGHWHLFLLLSRFCRSASLCHHHLRKKTLKKSVKDHQWRYHNSKNCPLECEHWLCRRRPEMASGISFLSFQRKQRLIYVIRKFLSGFFPSSASFKTWKILKESSIQVPNLSSYDDDCKQSEV